MCTPWRSRLGYEAHTCCLQSERRPSGSASLQYSFTDHLRRQLAAVNAIGNADAAVGVTGKRQAGMTSDQGVDARHAFDMTDAILRHRLRMAMDAREQWRTRDAEQFLQLASHVVGHGHVVLLEEVLLHRAA